MKKKVIILASVFMLFAGAVSASSINGDYSGYPIIKITSNGNAVGTGSVPALLIDNEIMIPATLLNTLGSTVSWDENKQSASINLVNKEVIKKKNDSAAILGARFVQVGFDPVGSYMSVILDASNDTANDMQKIELLSLLAIGIDVDLFTVHYYVNKNPSEVVDIYKSDINAFANGDLDRNQFEATWIIKSVSNQQSKQNMPIITSPVTSNVVESRIDGTFEGFEYQKIFKLQNGQIWQQDDFTLGLSLKLSPKVTIYKDGSLYKMIIDGVEKTVKVNRIK